VGRFVVRQLDKAMEHYQKAVGLQPRYVEAHCNMGVILKGQV
jgi:TPR repeat